MLTDLGNEQCRKLRETFPYHSKVDLVVSSPLRRAIYTALQGFAPVFKSKVVKDSHDHEGKSALLIVHPDLQETGEVPCDTGLDAGDLRAEVQRNGLPVDLGMIYDGWNNKVSPGPISH